MRKKFYFQKVASVLQNIVVKMIFLLLLSSAAVAQTGTGITITGKVTDAQTNEALVGVTVGIKGTTKGVFTDANGLYSITADPAATLVFTYLGYTRTEVAVSGKTTLNVKLPPSSEQLKDVVVTALGIKKERRALGYSVTEVKGSSLTEARDNNFVNGLEGKVAGVNVSGVSTGPGGSANVVIRGISDITGSNQPLYVIDGVPMTNGTSRQTDSQGYGGVDGGDETININPDDIETISVLKGAAASALYGYRGSKGVILITTKSGKNAKGTGVELNSNFVITNVIDNTDWQTTYGQGSNEQKPIDGPSAFETGLSAWGAKLDGKMVYQFDGVKRPYSEVANGNMGRFYKNGTSITNTVSFSKNVGDDGSVRFSASDLHDNSIIPNAGYKQQSFTLSANYKLDKHLDLQLKAQYIYAYTHNRPSVSDAPGNLNFATEFLPPNVNITTLAPGYKAGGTENQFLDDPYTTNPYFAAYKFINNTSRNRFIGSGDLKYTFDNGFYLQLRAGEDYFADRNTSVTPNGTAYEPTGEMNEENQKSSELNIDAIMGKEFKVTKDFNITALLGANSRKYVVDQIDAGGANFATPYLYTIGNLLYPRESTFNPVTVNKSIYGTLDFAYKNFLYLSATGRNDWYSTLAPGKKINYFYPSLSGSFVFSELIHIPGMDLGKLRVGYANVGGEADSPYQTLLGYNNIGNLYGHPIGNISNGGVVPNALLEPSSAKELEIGTELSFANNRLHFDIAYYNKKNSREVIPATISESSGYTNVILNSGIIQNKGIEFLVSGSPIKTKDFIWTESLNVSYNNNKVLALVAGLGNIPTGASSRAGEDEDVSVAYIAQTIGKSAYQIYVADPQRDTNGKIIIDPDTGAPAQGTNYVDVGSAMSPWTTGITSELRFKRFNFSFLLDGKFGGKIFSGTEWYGYNFGLSKATLPGRDKLYGDQKVFAQSYYQTIATNNPAIFVYDASFIKFRQLILGYTFPTSLFNNKIQAINLSFVARNLFTIMKHTPDIDPESNYSNGPQGIEQATVPYTRTFGFNLNVKF